jgi:hypothetical protein
MRDKKVGSGRVLQGRLTLVKKNGNRSQYYRHSPRKTGVPRYLIQVIFYAVAPDSHYVIGGPAPGNQIWILIGQSD